jgi:hypothetical protein
MNEDQSGYQGMPTLHDPSAYNGNGIIWIICSNDLSIGFFLSAKKII